ncbi:MAG: S8 family serine peptidase, partial [Candidatus Omnitrophica bacterium]|nr:S8 family serine peptidase [Candidatus Omnitrophota bacterium]
GEGYGLLVKEVAADLTYKTFSDYFVSTRQVKYISEYDENNIFIVTSEYNVDGSLVGQVEADGTEYTYFVDSGRMETKTMPDGIVYEYTNVDYMGEGYGLLIKETAVDGSYKTFSDYFVGTRQWQYVSEYDTDNVFIVVYEYNVNGKLVGQVEADGTEYTYFDSGRMDTKTMPDGTIYEYYDEAFYDNNTPSDLSDDYGRIYKYTDAGGKVLTYEAYYAGTDLKAKMTETGVYAGTLYYFYDSYDNVDANEIGFRKVDISGTIYDYKLVDGDSRMYYKSASGEGEYWFMWGQVADPETWPNNVGWNVVVKKDGSTESWSAYPFDPTSDPNNPTVAWNQWRPSTALSVENQETYSLPEWPPSVVDYPVSGDPVSFTIGEEWVANRSVTADSIDMNYFLNNVTALQDITLGEGVTVALLDTGVNAEVLDINNITGYDFAGSDIFEYTPDSDFSDVLGHGTQVASVLYGIDETGIAPDVDLMALKIFDDTGSTSSEIVADAIRYAVNNGADILSMSFSLLPINTLVTEAIDYALSQGAILIAAAGNDGDLILENSLAAQGGIITVGSVDEDGSLSAWSNYGSELDLLAPWDVVTIEGADGETGTSYSAAFITGLAALVLSENPEFTSEDVLKVIQDISEEGSLEEVGFEDYGTLFFDGEGDEEEEGERIGGLDVNDVISRYEVQRQNRVHFTGYSIIMDTYNVAPE